MIRSVVFVNSLNHHLCNINLLFDSPSLLLNYNVSLHKSCNSNDFNTSNSSSGSSSDSTDTDNTVNGQESNQLQIPEAPTNCCMSGCANCVWITYAEELCKIFKDGGEKSQQIILSKVTDENMKAFLKMELSFLAKNLKNNQSNK